MRQFRAALILVTIQLLLVLSVAGKYLYERKTCPRVWERATQYDPNQPLRGRYLALQLLVNACSLPRDHEHYIAGFKIPGSGAGATPGYWKWDVALEVTNGRIILKQEDHPKSSGNLQQITLSINETCEQAQLSAGEEYFISDRAKSPFPLKLDQELWVEVTVPPSGPPRPIQLALSSKTGFQTIHFN